jgi:hypothetical protein
MDNQAVFIPKTPFSAVVADLAATATLETLKFT